MPNQLTNANLTSIASKRIAGKAMTSARRDIGQEPIGSFMQLTNTTVFADVFPQQPLSGSDYLYLIQSASNGAAGSVMWVEFDLEVLPNTAYSNDAVVDASTTYAAQVVFDNDLGDQTSFGDTDTFHGYALKLPSGFVASVNAVQTFADHASTNKVLGTNAPFLNSFNATGSSQFQIVPEYVTTVTTNNPYIPYIIDKNGNTLPTDTGIDYYLDTAAGILFVQDPVDVYTATANQVPDKLVAFLYVGKYQNEITFGVNDVNFIVSGSDEGFAVGNDDTINLISGSAGITVESNGSPGTITIGESTDNITVNQITASIINAGKIEASEYIVSSSITYMTQSFSSGSTIFGDTNDDTHQFTGSISILHTGSGYGFELSGSSINIDAGSSGSLTLGTHNVGVDIASPFPITGSGLIVSQSNLPTFHYNMVKIGNVELLDYTGVSGDGFLIDTKDRSFIISSSDASKPVVQFKSADTKLYNGNGDVATQIDSTNSTFGTSLNSSVTTVKGNTTYLGGTITTHIRVHEGTPGNNTDDTDTAHVLFSVGAPVASFPSSQNKIESTPLNTLFTHLGGAVTASAVSSSGLLFASLSGNPTHNDGILAIVYDTGSGQFYYTGSYGAGGGDTTDLEASASQGIYFWTGSVEGTSIGLTQTASFTSSGAGLSVDLNGSTFTYTLTPQDVFDAFDTANTGSFTASFANTASFVITASHALTASKVNVVENTTSGYFPIVFTTKTGSAQTLNVDSSPYDNTDDQLGFYYNPGLSTLQLKDTYPSIIVISSSIASFGQTGIYPNAIAGTGSTYGILATQGPTGNTNTTLNIATNTNIINVGGALATQPSAVVNFKNNITVAGSASIEGDLIVKGAVTSINTTNLNVEDQFILLNSGSTTGDGGIIIQTSDFGGPNGPALYLDSSYSRFAVKKGVSWDQTGEITADSTTEYLVTVSSSDNNPTSVPQWGDGIAAQSYGQMFVNSNTGEIFIYG